MDIPKNLISYWIDLIHDELTNNPTNGLLLLYKSICGVYTKYWGEVIKNGGD